MTDPTDRRPLVPLQESAAILKLVVHRHNPALDEGQETGKTLTSGRRDTLAPDDPPLHKPSAAECYGCVEWFPF